MKCSQMNSRYCVVCALSLSLSLSRLCAIDAHWTDSREEPRDGERKQRVAWCAPGRGWASSRAATRYRNSLVAPFTDYSWRSVSRERRRASDCELTAAEGIGQIGLGKGTNTGQHWGPMTTMRLLSLDSPLGSARLYSPETGEKIRDLAQLRHAGPPLVGWLAGLAWLGLAYREPTGPPTATIHRNRAPSNLSDSHSSVYRFATSTESARGVRGGGEEEEV